MPKMYFSYRIVTRFRNAYQIGAVKRWIFRGERSIISIESALATAWFIGSHIFISAFLCDAVKATFVDDYPDTLLQFIMIMDEIWPF